MRDITQLSDDELRKIAGGQTATIQQPSSINQLSDDDLRKLAGSDQQSTISKVADFAFNPIAKTLTGKSLSTRLEDATAMQNIQKSFDAYGNNPFLNALQVAGNTAQGIQTEIAEGFTSPASVVGGLATKIPGVQQAGRAIANSPIGRGVGRIMNAPLEKIPSKAKNFVSDLITGPERAQAAAKEAKFVLQQESGRKIDEVRRIGSIKQDIAQRNADATARGYDDLSATMEDRARNLAREEGKNIQKELPKVFGKKSSEYGARKEVLFTDETNIPAHKVIDGLQDALEQHGIVRMEGDKLITVRAPMTPKEHDIYNLYTGTKQQLLDNPGAVINAKDLVKSKKIIEPDFGKAWTSDDKLQAAASQSLDRHLKDYVPGFKELQKEYAPFLEWKKSAIDALKPFEGRYNVSTDALGKQGSKALSDNEKEFFSVLQKHYESPHGTRIKSLNEGIQKTAANKERAALKAEETMKKLRNSIAKDIKAIKQDKTLKARDIDRATEQLIKKYTKQRILTVGVGALLGGKGLSAFQNFIKGQFYE